MEERSTIILYFYPPTAGEIFQIKCPSIVSSQFIFNLQTTDKPRGPPLWPTLTPNPSLTVILLPNMGLAAAATVAAKESLQIYLELLREPVSRKKEEAIKIRHCFNWRQTPKLARLGLLFPK